ncbi:YicC/YloC family endoribonuclease [Planctomycetaceae bacterium SH139]
MPRSMTGQGHAHHESSLGTFVVELRTVNNRGFKLSARLGDQLNVLEPQVDGLVRGQVRRGTVQMNVHWRKTGAAGSCQIDQDVIRSYYRQLDALREELGCRHEIDLSRLATLPGALVDTIAGDYDQEAVWRELAAAITAAILNLNSMRDREGAAMGRQLESDLRLMTLTLGKIRSRAPLVIDNYRDRLRTKVDSYLRQEGVSVETPELLREVQIYADRSDISEEITRLDSHIVLFNEALSAAESSGRKLDFVIQEMLRETNTIGSKASDAEIAHCVVEIKCTLERMRELVQNIE